MRVGFAITAVAALGAACAFAAVEETTSASATFKMYSTAGGTYSLSSAEDFATWQIVWRAGDTVTASPAVGEATILAENAASDGSAALPQKGGLWTLRSERSGTAKIGVPWSLFSDGGELAASGAATCKVDTREAGPNRKAAKRNTPPVSYTGDNWALDATAVSSLKFISPDAEETSVALAGTGAHEFVFDKTGVWTVVLTMADSTMKTAQINVLAPGLLITFR